jgi:hypothetical protein
MSGGKDLQVITFDLRGGQNYNYLGNSTPAWLHYNKDNRNPISPIRKTGGSEKRAARNPSWPDSTPPCGVLRCNEACVALKGVEQNRDRSGVPSFAIWLVQEALLAENPGTFQNQRLCRIPRSIAKTKNRSDGLPHFDEE